MSYLTTKLLISRELNIFGQSEIAFYSFWTQRSDRKASRKPEHFKNEVIRSYHCLDYRHRTSGTLKWQFRRKPPIIKAPL